MNGEVQLKGKSLVSTTKSMFRINILIIKNLFRDSFCIRVNYNTWYIIFKKSRHRLCYVKFQASLTYQCLYYGI